MNVPSPSFHLSFRHSVYCRPIIHCIEPMLDDDEDDDDDDGEDNNGGSSVVRYLHISDVPDEYSVGVFVFGPRARMPLHDHPG